MKFLCDQCKAKYQIADEKVAGKTVRMKCRKCGHHIEVRAEVTETSVSSSIAADNGAAAAGRAEGAHETASDAPGHLPPRAATPPQRPTASQPGQRTMGPLATSLTATKPSPPRARQPSAPKHEPTGALASAFQREVKEREEISASFDLAELSVVNEWYVAINGVPVGPIRISEVRRKAALGAVTEDSLAWQEGLEEWRPVRSFPELAAVVREAAALGRAGVMTPAPPDARSSHPPPAVGGWSSASQSRGTTTRPSHAARTSSGPAAVAASAVPVTARSSVLPAPAPASVAPDPFAALPPPAPAPAELSSPLTGAGLARPSEVEVPARKSPPWIAIAMVVLAAAFGVTAALAIFTRPQQAPVVIQMPSAAPIATPPPAATTSPPPAETAEAAPSSTPPPTSGKGGSVAMQGTPGSKPTPAAPTSTGLGLDLGSLKHGSVTPVGDDSRGGRASGQCLTSGQVSTVIGTYQAGIRRTCWERGGSQKSSANVNVLVSVGPNGNVESATASGDDPVIASCIQSNVRGWRFPAMGCTQQVSIPFHFVRQ